MTQSHVRKQNPIKGGGGATNSKKPSNISLEVLEDTNDQPCVGRRLRHFSEIDGFRTVRNLRSYALLSDQYSQRGCLVEKGCETRVC